MKALTDQEANDLQKEIDHILDSGANSIRLLEMVDNFLSRLGLVKNCPMSIVSDREKVIEECQQALYEQMFTFQYPNGYPTKAAPHAAIADLKAYLKLKTHGR